MVAVTAPAGMPCRQWSAAIVGGVWPCTEPASCQTLSEAQVSKGMELEACAEQILSIAKQVAGEQSGDTITGFYDACQRLAAACKRHAQRYFELARVSGEVGVLLAGLREDLDDLDARANAEIDEITQAMLSGRLNPLLSNQQIGAIVAQARSDATALSTKATAAITAQAASIGLGDNESGPTHGSGSSSAPADKCTADSANGMSAGWRRGPATKDAPAPKDAPHSTDRTNGGAGSRGHDIGEDKGSGSTKAGTDSDGSRRGDISDAGNRAPGEASTGHKQHDLGDSAAGAPSALSPPMSMPSLGSGGSGTPSMPSAGSSGLGSGGLNMPSTPAASTPAGLGSGLPSQGLSSPGLGGSGLSGGGGSGPVASSSDFSRGLSAGLGGPAAPFAPPVSPPPSTAAGSAGPAGGLSSAPPPVAAAAGGTSAAGPAVAPGPAMSSAGSAVGASGVPAGPAGPLPPFGSDVPRTAASTAAAVSPAAGPPAPAGPAAGGGSTGQVAPLPPGVVGSGVGASAGAASEGVRASQPDPLLDSASQLVYQLLHDSRMYALMDWCVGVFRTSSGIETVIVNGEGAGYIPTGVFVPRSARMLFADGGLPQEFRSRWFSWANPAETMLAYAELAADRRDDVDLWALAVSTDCGGSAMPARSVIQHFEECSRSGIPEGSPTSQLDDNHVHRLETMDRALYSRLTGFGDGPLPDRSEAWRTTAAAAQLALGRAGAIPDLAVAPVIREVLDRLGEGLRVSDDSWNKLHAELSVVVARGSGLRPGWFGSDGVASTYVRACHDLARLVELLLLWNLDNDENSSGIKYPDIAYLAGQIHLTPRIE